MERRTSYQSFQTKSSDNEQQTSINTPSNPPSPAKTDISNQPQPLSAKSRTTSHSLLSTSPNLLISSRKSRFADPGTTETVGRASISMPPPTSKPSSPYRPSPSRQSSKALVSPERYDQVGNLDGGTGSKASTELAMMEDLEKTPSLGSSQGKTSSDPYPQLTLPDPSLRPAVVNTESDGNRLSFSSLYSLGSGIYNGVAGISSAASAASAASSNAGSVRSSAVDQNVLSYLPTSPPPSSVKAEASLAITATDPILSTANSHSPHAAYKNYHKTSSSSSNLVMDASNPDPLPRPPLAPRCSRSRTQQYASNSNVASATASPHNSDRSIQVKAPPIGIIGICALDVKARSKASRNILTRLQSNGDFDVIVFGDKVILDEDVENWPICDFLISFFSDGFPLEKAIAYADLRKPFSINDLPMQKVLWDRRICLRILDCMGVPTPNRLEVNRDGGPVLESADLAERVFQCSGLKLDGPQDGTGGGIAVTKEVALVEDGDTLMVDGVTLRKPFVEKPICGEDHNIYIYFPKTYDGGGGRRLFRKIGNKSSERDENLIVPRAITEVGSSYVYEQFLHVDNAEDIKAYTVGPNFCHAETRKSPVVDGLVRRNTHGKEIRYVTSLTEEESVMAAKIANGFGQRICGFDLLRVGSKSYVIDVNGWSFVKDNNEYYDHCANILKEMFQTEKQKRDMVLFGIESGNKHKMDNTITHSKNTASGHQSAIQKMMKSPSLPKLSFSARRHNATSPELSATTVPLSSPPSFDHRPSLARRSTSLAKEDYSSSNLSSPKGSGLKTHSVSEVPPAPVPQPASKHAWKLKGQVNVIRHADRTPKQKFKFTFHTQPFVDLLKGHQEEVLLKGEVALNSVSNAVKLAMEQGKEDPGKLFILKNALARKGAWTGTKVQIKPMFRKRKMEETSERTSGDGPSAFERPADKDHFSADSEEANDPTKPLHLRNDSTAGVTLSRFSAVENDLVLDKLQLIIKWGGEPTHSSRYQSHDLGENMRKDLLLMNKEILDDVRIFTSSERRVSTSAQIWAASFLDQKEVPENLITVRKDLLDDSNAAKDVMDKVKKKLKLLLREGHQAPPQFAWPKNMLEPFLVVRQVVELMVFHRKVMRHNFKKLNGGAAASLTALSKLADSPTLNSGGALAHAQNVANVQARWCCGEDPELFKERWEKLFAEFCDSDKVDPSKISELYDTMKFDALHNRQFLEYIFTPSASMLAEDNTKTEDSLEDPTSLNKKHEPKDIPSFDTASEKAAERGQGSNPLHRIGFRRKPAIAPSSQHHSAPEELRESYFKLYCGSGQTRSKQDARLGKLRELYKLSKVLFDFVCPQEYGISNDEKLEIGLLTSLPLLKEIVKDLEEVQASDGAKSFIYFTKESHIYTLLNCILEGGIKTKIERNAIPELDYLSTISFELYESEDTDADTFAYSIRIAITPGCHTFDPLDVQLDSRHAIGCAPRRSLTPHGHWKEIIETLRAKFDTVKLPKSFLAVNLSESHTSGVHPSSTAETAEPES